MDQEGQLAASKIVDSLTGWWQLAGVDCAVSDDAVDWLGFDEKPQVIAVATPAIAVHRVRSVESAIEWPQDIETLRLQISGGAALPGNSFSNRHVAPVGPTSCKLMIVSDMPDYEDLAAGQLGSGTTGQLLARMLAAVGIDVSDCYWSALATTIPAAGDLPEQDLPELARFQRYQIGLVRPERVMLLGSVACTALLDDELMDARRDLRNINYEGGKTTVLTTFHPRTLLARAQMKARAWKDLQMLAAKDRS